MSIHFTYAQIEQSIPFIWSNDTLNGEYFEKTSMHIPVQLENDTTKYYFQFDTGSNKSFLYTGGEYNDSLIHQFSSSKEIHSNIGILNLSPRNSNSIYTKNGKIFIGTIGADFLTDKIIAIDFPNQKIHILNKNYDSNLYSFKPLILSFGRPVFSITIAHQTQYFMYDTGSSLFELWTTKRLWKKWKKTHAEVDQFPIRSWGKINISYRTNLFKETEIFNSSTATLSEIWYNSNIKFKWMFRRSKISGIIGNKPFLDHTILIDIPNRKIGIKK